jgi:hypothetical protein
VKNAHRLTSRFDIRNQRRASLPTLIKQRVRKLVAALAAKSDDLTEPKATTHAKIFEILARAKPSCIKFRNFKVQFQRQERHNREDALGRGRPLLAEINGFGESWRPCSGP